jgi:hypothetical protein
MAARRDMAAVGMEQAHRLAALQRIALPDPTSPTMKPSSQATAWLSAGQARVLTRAYGDIPATGKRIQIEGLDLFHLRDGKMVTVWIAFDNLGVLQQVSTIPTQRQAGPNRHHRTHGFKGTRTRVASVRTAFAHARMRPEPAPLPIPQLLMANQPVVVLRIDRSFASSRGNSSGLVS